MSDAKKKKRTYVVSPKGVAKFPHLTKPQTVINGKNVDPHYSIGLLVDPNDAEVIKFREKIEAAHAAAYAEAKKANGAKKTKDEGLDNIFKDEMQKDENGEYTIPTGKLEIRFKCKAGGTKKDGSPWTFRPFLYNAALQPLPADTLVYGGSVVQVSFSVQHTRMETGSFYTKLDLQAVMVHVLKSQSDRDGASFGFTADPSQAADSGEDASDESNDTVGAGAAPQSGADF